MRSEHLWIVFLLTCAQDYHPQGSTSNTADVFIDNLAEKAAQHLFHRTNVLKTLATFDITSSQLFSKLSVLLLSSGSNFTALSHIKMSLIWKMLQNFHLCFSLASVFLNFPLIPVQFVILDSWFVNLRYFIRFLFRVFVNLKNTEPCNAIKGCCIYKSAIGAHSRLITSPHLYITCSINTVEILDNRNVFKKEKKKKRMGEKYEFSLPWKLFSHEHIAWELSIWVTTNGARSSCLASHFRWTWVRREKSRKLIATAIPGKRCRIPRAQRIPREVVACPELQPVPSSCFLFFMEITTLCRPRKGLSSVN